MKIKELSKKQLLGVLGYWNNSPSTRKHFGDFESMLEACELGEGKHRHSPIVIKQGKAWHVVEHGCYHLYAYEELEVLEALAGVKDSESIDSDNPKRYPACQVAIESRLEQLS